MAPETHIDTGLRRRSPRHYLEFPVEEGVHSDILTEEEILRPDGSHVVLAGTEGLVRVALADSPGEYVALGLVVLEEDLEGRLVSPNLSPIERGLEGRNALIVAPDSRQRRFSVEYLRFGDQVRTKAGLEAALDRIDAIDTRLAQKFAGQWPNLLHRQRIRPENVLKAEFRTRISR